jgi:hypothetical protein
LPQQRTPRCLQRWTISSLWLSHSFLHFSHSKLICRPPICLWLCLSKSLWLPNGASHRLQMKKLFFIFIPRICLWNEILSTTDEKELSILYIYFNFLWQMATGLVMRHLLWILFIPGVKRRNVKEFFAFKQNRIFWNFAAVINKSDNLIYLKTKKLCFICMPEMSSFVHTTEYKMHYNKSNITNYFKKHNSSPWNTSLSVNVSINNALLMFVRNK